MMETVATRASALWRAMVYVAVVQLHLTDNVLMARCLRSSDVKERPAGHWGTVPGTAWALTHVALAAGTSQTPVVPLLGAGHAGVAQLALAWLTGDLAALRPQYQRNVDGLRELARAFPNLDGLGAEVHPLLPAGGFLGGCLGGALAFACGTTLDGSPKLVVPIIGDGECETPTTAGAWLPARDLPAGRVLPIVHLNGFRMGGPSLLGRMTDQEVTAYFAGQGWRADIWHIGHSDIADHGAFHQALASAISSSRDAIRVVVVLRCVKGWSGPAVVDGKPVLGTAGLHKTPLTSPADDPDQLEQLVAWLASFRPKELFDPDGRPHGTLAEALAHIRLDELCQDPDQVEYGSSGDGPAQPVGSFSASVTRAVKRHADRGDFRLFSPDELNSNRLGSLAGYPWCHEVLAEETLLAWLAGWTATGRRGLLIAYEAFASLFAAGLISQLKHRRLMSSALPSLNVLLTSYGWHNTYTHGDPSLATTLLGVADPTVRVLTPADPMRLALVLDQVLDSRGRLNVVIAGKHSQAAHPTATIGEELTRGLAIWPQFSDPGEPDLTVVCCGDLAADVTTQAVPPIQEALGKRVRLVNVADLTVLGNPITWPAGLTTAERHHYFGEHAAILVVTIGQPSAVWGLLGGDWSRPFAVIGWREPSGPLPQLELASAAGLDVPGLVRAAQEVTSRQSEAR